MTSETAGLPLLAEPRRAARSPEQVLLPVQALLRAQQQLTVVERFAEQHGAGRLPEGARYHAELIPSGRPGAGEQLAFQVDLDACTGCKACVAGCHTLNGLDEGEVWRTVGLLHGGSAEAPFVQTVTTSCHHCLEPACMAGCPVKAYEKDPVTGIVRHHDDQCFGCQYCTLMCPYDAPKYNAAKGIVRKCDLCAHRLAVGEAPACVQACPNEAISIRIVTQVAVVQASEAQRFLPGAAAPHQTLPTTLYKSARATPEIVLPADFYRTRAEHSHLPLVVMLTLTQLSVGALVLGLWVERVSASAAGSPLLQAGVACGLAVAALGASVLHLGRPWLAWRAVLGLRTSWLSREALAFGLFAQLAFGYGALLALGLPRVAPVAARVSGLGAARVAALAQRTAPLLEGAAALVGLVAVGCSVMVYVVTRRPQWSATPTTLRFFGTTVTLGSATVLAVCALTAPQIAASNPALRWLPWLIVGASAAKLALDAWVLSHVGARVLSVHKRAAVVMLGDLRAATRLRWALGALGGVVLPAGLGVARLAGPWVPALSALTLGVLGVAELVERYLFFSAAPASRMPGSLS